MHLQIFSFKTLFFRGGGIHHHRTKNRLERLKIGLISKFTVMINFNLFLDFISIPYEEQRALVARCPFALLYRGGYNYFALNYICREYYKRFENYPKK